MQDGPCVQTSRSVLAGRKGTESSLWCEWLSQVSQGISLFCLLFLQRNCLPEKASGFYCFLIHCGPLMESGSTYDVRVCKWHLEGGQEVRVTMGSFYWCLGSSSPAFFWGSSPGSSFIPQVSFTLKRIKSVFKLQSNDWIGDEIIPHQTPKSNIFFEMFFLGSMLRGSDERHKVRNTGSWSRPERESPSTWPSWATPWGAGSHPNHARQHTFYL